MQLSFLKGLAVAVAQVLLALAFLSTTACSTEKAARKSNSGDDPARAALVKELNALVAQGPIKFETDTDTLTDQSQILLQRIAAQMFRVPSVRVVIGGHADERGDTSYNLALGERRGSAACEYLVRLGVPKQRITYVSLGEEQPLAMGHDEASWGQNRRDEFLFMLPGDAKKSALMIGVTKDEVVASTTWGPAQDD